LASDLGGGRGEEIAHSEGKAKGLVNKKFGGEQKKERLDYLKRARENISWSESSKKQHSLKAKEQSGRRRKTTPNIIASFEQRFLWEKAMGLRWYSEDNT